MAKNETKHKSKWKEAKDTSKSLKPETRKDLKDYTAPDAHGMVPNLVDGVQPLVPRNINGKVLEDIENMVPEIKNRLYKKVEDGEYSPKQAREVFEKLQIEDSEGYLDVMENGVYNIKESINRLSESQKEKLVRMYVRNKIVKVLQEQPTPPADPMADPMATPPADPMADPMATPPADTEQPAEETSATKAESAAGIFTTALDSVYLESIALGVEIALKPLINQFEKNKDQHEATKQAIYTTLANANIKYVRPATTDHTKDNLPDQDIPTSDASDLA
jgi:hypothetical protein